MFQSLQQKQRVWILLIYFGTLVAVLYPALHEGFGVPLTLWNCLPPTIGLALVAAALGKSSQRFAIAGTFAIITIIVAIFVGGMWFFTPLDTDPHSITTKLVFVFVPILSLGIAIVGSGLVWLLYKAKSESP